MNTLILPMPQLVLLDRDGVINYDSDQYIKSATEWLPIESSICAIRHLNENNIKIGIASNQRGIAKGLLTIANLTEIHQKMADTLKQNQAHVDAIRFCPALERSHPDHKPNPGMLLSLLAEFKIDATREPVYFVGDKESDLNAALNAHCIPVLVRTGKGRDTELLMKQQHINNLLVFDNLLHFVYCLLKKEAPHDPVD